MNPSLLFRISSVLLLIFSGAHTYGLYHQSKVGLLADAVMASMRTVHFDIMGFNRSYWDFYSGFGLLLTVFLLFSALLAWQLGDLVKGHARLVQGLAWPFALCHTAVAIISWTNFFPAPGIVSSLIAACLILAAVQTGRK
jgi:hypothetical protein